MKIDIRANAAKFAVNAHGDQMYGDHPYSYHLSSVVANTMNAVSAQSLEFQDNAICAAWLHDTAEDTDVTVDELAVSEFGRDVAQAVWHLTNLNRNSYSTNEERKIATAQKTATNVIAVVVKVADRLSNVQEGEKNDKYRKEHENFEKWLFSNKKVMKEIPKETIEQMAEIRTILFPNDS